MIKEKTVTPEKISLFKDHDDVMKRILNESRREIERLQGEREILIIKNTQLADDLVRKQGQFEQWKRGEEQKMQDIRTKLNNEVIKKEKVFEVGELDLSRRIEEVARREALGNVIIEKQVKLNNDRIEVEKLRTSANLLMDNANLKMSSAISAESQANILFAKAKDIESKANAINDGIVKRENDVSEKEKEISIATKNFEELKKIVEPKILEIKEREENLLKDKKELLDKESDVNNKLSEEKVLLVNLEEMKKKLKDREKELDQKEEEITRKALMAGVDGK